MKRLVRYREEYSADEIRRVVHILVCDDVRTVKTILSSEVSQDDEMSADEYFSTFTDGQLKGLSEEDVQSVEDLELLVRLAKVDRSKLSADQLKILKDGLSEKKVLSKESVERILAMIQVCNSISYERRHSKTNSFLLDEDGNFKSDECLSIIKELTIKDYVASTRSYNPNHIGNDLIIFEPDADWVFDDGSVAFDLIIYVKLDVDSTDGNAVALVSMHPAEYVDEHPYFQDDDDEQGGE